MTFAVNPHPLWMQIYLKARDIESVRNPDTISSQKEILSELIRKYLSNSNLKDRKCNFYAKDLAFGLSNFENGDLDLGNLRLVAHKVKIAARYLSMAQTSASWSLLPRPINITLASALAHGQKNLLRDFSHHLNEIDPKQVESLYDWAFENWDLHIIYEILKKCPISTDRLDSLVTKAFETNLFQSISFPLVLNHLEALSDPIRARVEKWMSEYEPRNPELQGFQKALRERLKRAKEPNSFKEFLNRNLLIGLPLKLLRKLVDWANDHDDEELLLFLIEESVLPGSLLNEIVTRSIQNESFRYMSQVVKPEDLSPETQALVQRWQRGYRPLSPTESELN